VVTLPSWHQAALAFQSTGSLALALSANTENQQPIKRTAQSTAYNLLQADCQQIDFYGDGNSWSVGELAKCRHFPYQFELRQIGTISLDRDELEAVKAIEQACVSPTGKITINQGADDQRAIPCASLPFAKPILHAPILDGLARFFVLY
jgi:hypothetical protein